MTAGIATQCTIHDPVPCGWTSGHAPSLLIAVQRLLKRPNLAHPWGGPWTFSYSDPATGEIREAT